MNDKHLGKRKIIRVKLSDTVEKELEELIISRHFDVGEQLPSERDLMKTFGVGRPSIREALSGLQRKGLLILRSGERPIVTEPSPALLLSDLSSLAKRILSDQRGLLAFQEFRELFEIGLVRQVTLMATDEDIYQLQEALHNNRLAIENEESFARTDIAFHRVLAVIPNNPIYIAIHEALVEWLIKARPKLKDFKKNNKTSFKFHEALVKAISNKEIYKAQELMSQHMNNAVDTYSKNP